MFAYVGSRTSRERNARGEGISVFEVSPKDGSLNLIQVLGGLINPSFLALNQAGNRLCAVHGDSEFISSFAVDTVSGKIELLNQTASGGKNPVHLALDASEQYLVVSNHLSSNLAVIPLADDGSLKPLVQTVKIEGEPGPHRKEQPFAKPHFNPFSRDKRFVFVPDKGIDKTLVYRFQSGQLSLQSELMSREGAARHCAEHPQQQWVYIVNELDSTVTASAFDEKLGELTAFQIVSTLADSFTGNSRAAEIEIHPNGKFLYASNRGEDSIAVFSIDAATGRLSLCQTQSTLGKTPRFFTLHPSGSKLYALNEDSDSIVMFDLNEQTGLIQPSVWQVGCGSPVCMVFSS